MSRNRFGLGGGQRWWLHVTFAVLFLTGVVWWILHRWGGVETEFGPTPHPWNPWLLRLHGAGAMVALVVVGTLLGGHVRAAWRAGCNRVTGAGMIAVCGGLSVSGYALYYVGSEAGRALASWVHLGLGVAFPAALIVHIWRGRRARRDRPAA
jgi:hypothetical protein